jgi:hypothetical protein
VDGHFARGVTVKGVDAEAAVAAGVHVHVVLHQMRVKVDEAVVLQAFDDTFEQSFKLDTIT